MRSQSLSLSLSLSLFLLLLLLTIASAAQANNFFVSSTADSGAGSLRQAILDSNSPAGGVHTMTFSAAFPDHGVILLNSNLPQTLSQSLIIMGDTKRPRIDGQSLHSLFNVGSGTATFELSDMVLQNALAAEGGACIHSGDSSLDGQLRTERVSFQHCQAVGPSLINGGAIYWNRSNGSIWMVDSEFLNNSVTATAGNGQSYGGAIYSSANLTSQRTLFQGNSAQVATTGGGNGGAIFLIGSAGLHTIAESTFRFNSASPASSSLGYGGAINIFCDGCTTRVEQSYLRGNAANFGGAIFARKSNAGVADVMVSLANSTFYNSSVLNSGGALFAAAGAVLSASNNTFYNGDASDGAHLGFAVGSQINYFRANLLAPTYAGTACSGTPVIAAPGFVGFNLFADASCNTLGSSSLPNSPLGAVFVDERSEQIGVLRFSGSAVIDSIGNDTICELSDARSQSRPIDGNGDGTAECDVGAYEDPRDIVLIIGFDS